MTTATMTPATEDLARERIEAAIDESTYCTLCGGSMGVAIRGEEMWVECEHLQSKSGLRLALASGFHDRRHVELPEGVLAAA